MGRILFVVCTFRKENVIRIISARRATEFEKARYEHGADYAKILSHLLDLALNDAELVKKCISI